MLFVSSKTMKSCTFKIRKICIKQLTGYLYVVYIFLYSFSVFLNTKLISAFVVKNGDKISIVILEFYN